MPGSISISDSLIIEMYSDGFGISQGSWIIISPVTFVSANPVKNIPSFDDAINGPGSPWMPLSPRGPLGPIGPTIWQQLNILFLNSNFSFNSLMLFDNIKNTSFI